jgi:hypothetical protein
VACPASDAVLQVPQQQCFKSDMPGGSFGNQPPFLCGPGQNASLVMSPIVKTLSISNKTPLAPALTTPAEPACEPCATQQPPGGEGRKPRIWALALGTAAIWHLDPAIAQMAEMVAVIACTDNKSLAKDAIAQMRTTADSLRSRIEPLPASALTKVVRRAEAACGAVLDKGVRVREVQASWDSFVACMKARRGA